MVRLVKTKVLARVTGAERVRPCVVRVAWDEQGRAWREEGKVRVRTVEEVRKGRIKRRGKRRRAMESIIQLVRLRDGEVASCCSAL